MFSFQDPVKRNLKMALQPNVLQLELNTLAEIIAANVSPSALSRLRRGDSQSTVFVHENAVYRVRCTTYGVLLVVVFSRASAELANFRIRSVLIDRIWIRNGNLNFSTLRRDLVRRRRFENNQI